MGRVRFDQSLNTHKTFARNKFQEWWKPDEVPFVQLLHRRRDLKRLTSEEIDELLAYYFERNAKGKGQRAKRISNTESRRLICAFLDEYPDIDSETLGRLFRLHQLQKVLD